MYIIIIIIFTSHHFRLQGRAGRSARGHREEVGGREHRERKSSSEDDDMFHTISLDPGVHRGAPRNGSVPGTASQVGDDDGGGGDDDYISVCACVRACVCVCECV